jgi:hypothetical protein
MDTYLVICEGHVVEKYTSLEAAREYVQNATSGTTSVVVYQVAHVVATSKSIRIWNAP